MNRNANYDFSKNPSVHISRSQFNRDHGVKFTGSVGDLIPFMVEEILPGDTVVLDTSKVVRLATPVVPIMDNLFLDTYYFFVPNRLVWEHWQNFQGENTESAWIPETEYTIPQLEPPSSGWSEHSVADYMGIPIDVATNVDPGVDPPPYTVNALPFRAYALICDQWFRDENLSDPLWIPKGDSLTSQASSDGTYITSAVLGLTPFKVAKFHDYFTSCLPSPLKHDDVMLPLGRSAPVVTGDPHSVEGVPLHVDDPYHNLENYIPYINGQGNFIAVPYTEDEPSFRMELPEFDNLWADLSLASGVSINQVRMAFQLQKLYESDARGGTRYTEILRNMFGVDSPDARLQRSEYLGGNRIPITIAQVTDQSSGGLGQTGAVSLTTDHHSDFTFSAVEHGYIIGVCAVRYHHTYSQGLERMWSRKTRYDFYMPVLAHIGEQAVLNKEIYLQGNSEDDDKAFGYQEAWADYRYKPSRVAGYFRPQSTLTMDFWHFADHYESLPYLSDGWIREDKNNVARTLAVQEDPAPQLLFDFWIRDRISRPMPLYSIPGLIDHF